MIDAITFGVEFEVSLPFTMAAQVQVGAYHRGIQVPGLPEGWNAQGDGSIRPARGCFGVEIVSPVLCGANGAKQLIDVCKLLNQWGAKVNQSCGFHVHVGFAKENVAGLERLVSLVAQLEGGIWAATGTKARERGMYARSIREDFRNLSYRGSMNALGHPAAVRYHLLNVSNLMHPAGKPTVEFRAFAGTTNGPKALAYVRACLGLVERALTESRKPKYDPKALAEKSPMKRKGAGYSELTRLLYSIGWIKGRRDRAYGAVGAGVDGIPTMESSKKELRRLARKYDRTT